VLADDAGENNGVWRREKDGVGAVVWEKRENREKGMKSVWRGCRECCAESA